MVIAKFWGRSA